jgi:hypothetical protein
VPSVPGGSLVVKVERHRADGLGLRAIATKLGISVNTLQKARLHDHGAIREWNGWPLPGTPALYALLLP